MIYGTKQVIVEAIDAATLMAEFDTTKKLINEVVSKLLKDSAKENLMTREETAKFLKVSLPTIHDWTKKGILKAYRFGNTVRYKEAEIVNSLVPIPRYNKSSNPVR